MPRRSMWRSRSIALDLTPSESPESVDLPKHVVVVMDGLKEFTVEPLEWLLKNIVLQGSLTITILGVMPWLNIPLSAKTWSDIWTMDLEDLSLIKEKMEYKSDVKYQKLHRLVDLCQQYGVVPQVRTEMGYPLRLVVIEQITSLHATLVVFDRYHDRKHVEYYAAKVPCNMLVMNEEGEVDMIKGRPRFLTSTPGRDSPAAAATTSLPPTPKLILSDHFKKILRPRTAVASAAPGATRPTPTKLPGNRKVSFTFEDQKMDDDPRML